MRAPISRFVSLFAICEIAVALAPAQIPLGGQVASSKLEACTPPVEWWPSLGSGFKLPLNHSDLKSDTFCNRYWLQTEFYKVGGPVFILHAGEDRGEKSLGYIKGKKNTKDKDLSVFETFLKAFNGLGVVMEHRYYGGSVPKGVKIKDKKDVDFRYLTTEWALADVDVFVSGFWRKEWPNVDFSPKSTRWISMGGSYPGMMAAMMRIGYPDTIFAAYASSAPIQASIEMPGYYDQIWEGINAYSKSCAADLTAAIKEIDKRLKDTAQRESLKESLLGCQKDKKEVPDARFASDLSTMFDDFQNNGMDDGEDKPNRLRQLCDYLAVNEKGKMADERGWAAVQGVDSIIKKLQKGNALKAAVGVDDLGYVPCTKTNDVPSFTNKESFSKRRDALDNISWTWQRCRDFGYFFVANLGPRQIVLSAMDRAYQQNFCHDFVQDRGGNSYMPAEPDVETTNKLFKGWNARPTRTFWTAGQFDPWTALSPFSKQATNNKIDRNVPLCSLESAPQNPIFGYQLDGAEHCFDFNKTASGTDITIATFKDALTKWFATCKKPTVLNKEDSLQSKRGWKC
jgi:hypothetical protein